MTITVVAAPRGTKVGVIVGGNASAQMSMTVAPKAWRPAGSSKFRAITGSPCTKPTTCRSATIRGLSGSSTPICGTRSRRLRIARLCWNRESDSSTTKRMNQMETLPPQPNCSSSFNAQACST